MKPVLLDSGVVVALLDRSEFHHKACVDAMQSIHGSLVTCEAVIAESCYLLRKLKGAPEAVLDNVANGIFQIPFQLSGVSSKVRSILRRYRDQQIDLADACLICMAEEFGSGEILTMDSDFDIYRWGRNKVFHRLPEIR